MTPDEQHAYGVTGIPSQPETDWALLVVDDLTEQERRELAEREFVSNAAHELRTPLTTIIGAVEVLQAGAKEDPAERDRFLGHIEREAGRLARLARAMLTLARAHSGQEPPRVEAVELAPLLREVAAGLQPHAGVAVDVEVADGLAVEANRDLLEQALRNLGENAAKHTARGSVVLRAYGDGNTVTVEVEDSGPGISPEVQRHVFDRFYRGERDAHGFGLGLAIVRESVRTLGARIELDSSPGEGTVFRILLAPARVREEVPRVNASTERRADPARRRRRRACATSSPSRCGARASRSTRSGTGRRRSSRAARAATTLVVLDVMLPGLSGIEVCRALRAESDVPILMLTARDAESDRVLGLELGADDYVTKPFSSAELLSRVRAILRRRELDRATGGATVRKLGGLQIDLGRHEVLVDGERVHLTLSEFKVLSLLAEQPESVVSRRELMQHLWASEHVGDEHACEVHISNLRRKIERDPSQPERLVTVRGSGYKLVAA